MSQSYADAAEEKSAGEQLRSEFERIACLGRVKPRFSVECSEWGVCPVKWPNSSQGVSKAGSDADRRFYGREVALSGGVGGGLADRGEARAGYCHAARIS